MAGSGGNNIVATSDALGYTGGVAVDPSGDLLLDDQTNDVVSVVANFTGSLIGSTVTAYDIYAVAGTGAYSEGRYNGPATNAEFSSPSSVRVDSSGDIVIADTGNDVVRFIPAVSGTYFGHSMTAGDIYDVAGNGQSGSTGDGGVATSGELDAPGGANFDAAGDIIIADTGNNVIRFVPASSGTYFGVPMTVGDIYTIAGNHSLGFSANGTVATAAALDTPTGAIVDAAGDLIVADTYNNVIRFVPKTSGTYFNVSMTAGAIYTVAGNTTSGYSGDTGPATSAELKSPTSVTLDSSGGLVISDSGNSVVRYVPRTTGAYFGSSLTANDIYTVVGNATQGYSGNSGPATSAELHSVNDAVVDSSGNLFVVDSGNDVIRFVPASTGLYFGQSMLADNIYPIAGAGWTNTHFSGDGGSPLQAEFAWILSVAPDGSGGYFIDDDVDQRVRHVTAVTSSTFAATTSYTYNADGQKTSMTTPDGNLTGANAANFTTTYSYGANGTLTSQTQGGGSGSTATARTTVTPTTTTATRRR